MKYSALYPIVAGLALGAMLLPAKALAEKKTPFTATETDTEQNSTWFANELFTEWYIFDGKSKFDIVSDESRVAGSGWYSIWVIYNVISGAATFWGQYHVENERGAWDGYYSGSEAQDGFMATLVGSGEYKGLVSRWTSTAHGDKVMKWSGYIVENGPGDVPLKVIGGRDEAFMPIPGVPSMVKVISIGSGGGLASHIGAYKDIQEIGLMDVTTGIARGVGIAQAANGDRYTWLSFGQMNPVTGQHEASVFFAGGTGRFEHVVGVFAPQVEWTTFPTSYTYKGTGTICY